MGKAAVNKAVAKMIDLSVTLIQRNDPELKEMAISVLQIASEILVELEEPELPQKQ